MNINKYGFLISYILISLVLKNVLRIVYFDKSQIDYICNL